MLSSHLRLGLPSGLLPSGLLPNIGSRLSICEAILYEYDIHFKYGLPVNRSEDRMNYTK
jgi:hypothetical protein